MKPSILFISDFPNWAYHSIPKFVVNNLAEEFDFYSDFLIFNTKRKSLNPIKRIKSVYNNYKFSETKKGHNYDIVVYLAFYFDNEMKVKWHAKKIIKGIYTDGFPPSNTNYQGEIKGFLEMYFSDADAMVCGSHGIKKLYADSFKNVFYANAIIDEGLFTRKRKKEASKTFVIGWTGNPKRDFKGYYSHVVPVVEKLKMKYPDIELKSRFSGPLETLPDFYEDVDLVVIASDADAGPSMFGEASLMGIPTVSTNMGWPSQVIKDGVNGFIVEKSIDDIYNKVELLFFDRELLQSMSARIRKDFIHVFDKEKMVDRWRQMFNQVLE